MTGGHILPPAKHFFVKITIFHIFIFPYVRKQISTTLQGFVISSIGNPFMRLSFSFNVTFTDILKRDVVSKKTMLVSLCNESVLWWPP